MVTICDKWQEMLGAEGSDSDEEEDDTDSDDEETPKKVFWS